MSVTQQQVAKAVELDNFRPWNRKYVSEDPELTKLVDRILNEARAKGPFERVGRTRREHMRAILLDLWLVSREDTTRVLSVSMDTAWVEPDRYCYQTSPKTTVSVVKCLRNLGYIDFWVGYQDPDPDKCFQSRMRATERLRSLFRALDFAKVLENPLPELVKLKNSSKRFIEYSDTRETNRMRSELVTLNKLLAGVPINIAIPDTELHKLIQQAAKNPKKPAINLDQKQLYRVFNNGTFEQGGRFYGGWWQQVPSQWRDHIIINNQRTVEVDFSSLHLRMLFAREGIHCPQGVDAYDVAGIPREVVKLEFNIVMNADNLDEALEAALDEVNAIRDDQGNKVYNFDKADILEHVNAIKAAYPKLAKYLHRGMGLKLQKQDSDMAAIIMLRMLKQFKTPALPIHDSFRVIADQKDNLKKVMTEVFQQMNGTTCPVKSSDVIQHGLPVGPQFAEFDARQLEFARKAAWHRKLCGDPLGLDR